MVLRASALTIKLLAVNMRLAEMTKSVASQVNFPPLALCSSAVAL